MSKKNILIAFTLLLSLQSFADANVWREMPTAEINIDGERKLHPNIFKVYNLNDAYFKTYSSLYPKVRKTQR